MFLFGKSPKPKEIYTQNAFKARALEEKILELSGLELHKELHILDVPIEFQGELHHIHTYRCGEKNLETLVLIHGYEGCSLFFFQMLKDLAQKYQVFCIDLLGMGLSSRHEFKCKSTEETIEYFIDSIEKWREAVEIGEFYLAGLSFGGYMSAQYSLKYQERITKLFLISPAGLTNGDWLMDPREWAKTLPFFERQKFLIKTKGWEDRVSPAEYYQKYKIIAKIWLKNHMYKKFSKIGKENEVAHLLFKFYSKILKLPSGSDKSVYFILKSPKAYAKIPLEDLISKELNIPTVCYYGDRDWMDPAGAFRIAESGKKGFKVKVINESGHLIPILNPKSLYEDMMKELMDDKKFF